MATIDHNPWEKSSQVAQPSTSFVRETLKKNVLDIQPARILAVWPFIILGGLLGLFISWTYLRYSINIYQVTTSAVLENNKEI